MGSLGCGAQCVKFILVVSNLCVFLVGFSLTIIGIWFLASPKAIHYLGVATDDGSLHLVRGAAVVILVVGVASMFVGMLGCSGARRERASCLACYSFSIALVLFGEVLAVVLAGVFHGRVSGEIEHAMSDTLQKDYGRIDVTTKAWDFLQRNMTCCGVRNEDIWQKSFWYNNTVVKSSRKWPESCCRPNPKGDISKCYSNKEGYYHDEGCMGKLEDWAKHHVGIIIGFAVLLLCLQLAAIILSCTLKSNINKRYEHV